MNPNAIYVRTDKGAEEIAHRSQAIPAKARSLLLMIDGKLSGAQLLDKFASFPNSNELLQMLEDGAYITAQAGGPGGAPAAATAVPTPAAAPAANDSFTEAKRLTIRSLNDILGPDADIFSPRVEAALTAAELRVHAQKFRDIFVDMGRKKMAADFWQEFEKLLPPQ